MLAHRLGVADRVAFLGRVDVIERFYAAADVLVHPAHYDPFPNAILEALACGVPVITTPGCGGAEAIEDGKSGYIIENDSQLVDGLHSIAEPGRRAEMGDLARRRAEQFSLAHSVDRTLKVIEDVIAEKASMPMACHAPEFEAFSASCIAPRTPAPSGARHGVPLP